MIACAWAHVRDGCLIYAISGEAHHTHYIPTAGLTGGFSIEAPQPPPPPVTGSGATAVHDPRGLKGLVGRAAARTGTPPPNQTQE